jgi:hypothetical protein
MRRITFAGVEWESTGPGDKNLLKRLEDGIEAELPESYRSFLLEVNGGEPVTPLSFEMHRDDETSSGESVFTRSTLAAMYSLTGHPHYPSVMQVDEDLPALMLMDCLPIGRDGFNGQLCIDLEDNTVLLFAWDVAPEPGDVVRPFNVARTFDKFLEMLRTGEYVP